MFSRRWTHKTGCAITAQAGKPCSLTGIVISLSQRASRGSPCCPDHDPCGADFNLPGRLKSTPQTPLKTRFSLKHKNAVSSHTRKVSRHEPTATFCQSHAVAAPGHTLGHPLFLERTPLAAGPGAPCAAAPDLAGAAGLPSGAALKSPLSPLRVRPLAKRRALSPTDQAKIS